MPVYPGAPKNTEADLRISFARRNSKFSARSLRISSRSELVGRSARATIGLRLTHLLTQRLSMDAKVRRDMRDRPAALQREPNATRDELIGVLLRASHEI